jgi:two-component system sensor histidine kinase HydH
VQRKGPGVRLPLPLITILASVLTLLVLLAISTYRNVERERSRTEEFLRQQGAILIMGLEAGARTGMMRMAWQEEVLQALVEEVASSAGLAGIRVLEPDGRIVAESRAAGVKEPFDSPVPLADLLDANTAQGWRQGELYVVGKRFVPLVRGMGMGHGPGMGMGPGGGRGWPRPVPPPRIVLVGMYLAPYLEAQREDLRHALLMGFLLLLIGSASFYFIFVVQNLRLVRRTLRGMTTYTGHLVEHMPDGLVSVSDGGEILTVNGRARVLLGLADPPVGKPVSALGPTWEAVFQRVRGGQRVLEEETESRSVAGDPIPLAVSASRVQGMDGEELGAVILLRDLREVRTLQERLRRSERLASLGQLAAGVAHEIRNPLSSIRGFAQLFRKRFEDGSEDQRYAEVMVQEVDRLNRVIANLLDFARPQELVLREIRPREVAEHALALVRKEAEARSVRIRLEGNADPQLADPDQLTQALLNLMLNGLEAMDTGGELGLELGSGQEGKGWTLRISDTGEGIPRENLSRLFDPFFTTKKRGTGLGLAIVHRIVESHGGSILVESEPGRGTSFVLSFPGN